eukprot:1782005-Amphidinium_carterae.1
MIPAAIANEGHLRCLRVVCVRTWGTIGAKWQGSAKFCMLCGDSTKVWHPSCLRWKRYDSTSSFVEHGPPAAPRPFAAPA